MFKMISNWETVLKEKGSVCMETFLRHCQVMNEQRNLQERISMAWEGHLKLALISHQ